MTGAGQERAIGRVEGKIDHIIADQERARDERKRQYERQEATDRLIEQLSVKMASVDSRLQKVEGPVAEFSRWKERGVGAMMLVSFCAATFGAMIATFWKKLSAFFMG